MKTVADPAARRRLVERLRELRPDSGQRWGTLTPHEMLCHLGDGYEMVLRIRPRATPLAMRQRRLLRWIGLWTPFRWPHGWQTNPMHDPRALGTRPSEFAADLRRVIAGMEGLATAHPAAIDPVHGLFGTMSLLDWQRWAWKHTDHHLRQFGV